MALDQNILDLRKKNGLSQEQLGEKVKITEKQNKTIKKIVKGFLIGFIAIIVIELFVFVICFTQKIRPFKENNSESVSHVIQKDGEL